jgi:large subunit ribosomal protein L21
MYAIIEDSGTQIKASEGDELILDVRELADDASTLTFDRILMVGGEGEAKFGAPYVEGATVTAEIIDRSFKGEKIDVIKFKRRKGYRRKQGHRQRYMRVKVTGISG